MGEGAGGGLPGAVGELEAGDQVARAVLRGGGAPLAVELVAEQGLRLVGASAAHGDPARLGERGRDVREQGRDVLGGLGKLAEDEADAAAVGAQRAEHRAVGDAADLDVDLLRKRLVFAVDVGRPLVQRGDTETLPIADRRIWRRRLVRWIEGI